MAELGIDKEVRKKAVGHSADSVHDRYTHYQDAALRDAASQAELHVMKGGNER